ncbi:type I-F CRISPR-associated protein Csy1 [Candidatus Spongiihabitans sp.]|uniref:type I-F CRISPR-associated protein Csy1 n=1 Tax=Candidatus Spongiihabitans sp. TaxID=3101308 RepID=UPI003C6FBF16
MDNAIRKHIDSLKRKRLKVKLDSYSEEVGDAEKNTAKEQLESEYKYDEWLIKILSINKNKSYFPESQNEVDLNKLLSLEVIYKQTFKSVCDTGHPVIEELLADLKLSENQVKDCIEKAKKTNIEPLEYYALFEEELLESNLSLDRVQIKIDQLAQDCSQGTIISHSAKMTNPACRYPKIFSAGKFQPDGFIRTGNSTVDFDMHINATKLKVFKFLSLKYQGKTLLDYIKNKDNSIFQQLFNVSEERAKSWVESFSSCINSCDLKTNGFIRQSYFPVLDGYQLLSLLQPSGLVFALKERIDSMNDRSPESYIGKNKKKKGEASEVEFSSITNLTVTKHGGDHPKNISGLNNKYQSYYLLQSLPPGIEKRSIYFPKTNFFNESFRYQDCRDIFYALHKILKTDYNNINIREGRDYRLQELVDRIIDKMWAVRSVAKAQYHADSSQLKSHQKIWLCEGFLQEREESDIWLDKLSKEISIWTILTYEKILGKQAIKLGEAERLKIVEIVSNNKEALR